MEVKLNQLCIIGSGSIPCPQGPAFPGLGLGYRVLIQTQYKSSEMFPQRWEVLVCVCASERIRFSAQCEVKLIFFC